MDSTIPQTFYLLTHLFLHEDIINMHECVKRLSPPDLIEANISTVVGLSDISY